MICKKYLEAFKFYLYDISVLIYKLRGHFKFYISIGFSASYSPETTDMTLLETESQKLEATTTFPFLLPSNLLPSPMKLILNLKNISVN